MSIIRGKLLNAVNLNAAFISKSADETITGYKKFTQDIYSTKLAIYTDSSFATTAGAIFFGGGNSFRFDAVTANNYFDFKPRGASNGIVLRASASDVFTEILTNPTNTFLGFNSGILGLTLDGSGNATVSGNILTSNYVGIGVTVPASPLNTYKLPVADTFVDQIRVNGTGNYKSLTLGTYGLYDGYLATYGDDLHILAGQGVATENHNINFYTSFVDANGQAEKNKRMIIRYDGNIGIGNSGPTEKLHVTGNILTSGYLKGAYGTMIDGATDSWLRINAGGSYASGIYCGSSLLRTDGAFHVGSSGITLNVTGSTLNYLNGKFTINTAGTTLTAGDSNVQGIIYAKSGGTGKAIQIGDDSYLSDINQANRFGIQGQQDAAQGGFVFGSALDTNLYRGAAGQVKTDGNLAANVLISTVAIGTAPLLVTSTTTVTNFSSDTVDGYHHSDLLKSDTNSEQTVSASVLKVQSTTSTERFEVEFNETAKSLDFCYYTA